MPIQLLNGAAASATSPTQDTHGGGGTRCWPMTFWATGNFAIGSVRLQTTYDNGANWIDIAVLAPASAPISIGGPYPIVRAITDVAMTGTASAYIEPTE